MTLHQPTTNDELRRDVAGAIHAHWGLFLFEGIVLVLLGFAAIVVPVVATLAFTLVIGWLFLISGGVGLVTTFWMRNAPGFWWALLSAAIALAAGVILILRPISGVLSLTLVLIAFFVVEGIATLMYAIEHKAQLSGRWGWMLASGVVDLILAGIIFAGLPGTAAWALGLLVGINMLFGGTAMIGMALAARNPA
ncbi:MAG: HdeD family acid-resistance protein [Xanthobacteraceae bacterium]